MFFYRLALLCDNPSLYKYAEHFVANHEMFCCSLMQKILSKSDDVYVITCVDLFGHEIKVMAVFSYNGYTMNLCLPHLNRRVVSILRNFILLHNIFCVSAKTEWAEFVKDLIFDIKKCLPDDVRDMDLLLNAENASEAGRSFAGPRENESGAENVSGAREATVIRCNENDADLLMPLQINYVQEEVLPPWKKVMPASERLNVESALKTEWVFALKYGDRFVSKVQTNAITKKYVQVGGVYTVKTERKKGYARTLINYLVNEAKTHGKKVVLYVRRKNEGALALYRSCSFVKEGSYSIYYYKKES